MQDGPGCARPDDDVAQHAPVAGPDAAPHRAGARAMTNSQTRVAEQRWHYGFQARPWR